ncbi:MAG: hypothetical protein H0T56_04285 [Pseudaminobacter sp.]|nr:hypothetical protein [Pseudaminobacter sp.]
MEFLAGVEQLGAVRALKSSFFAYPVVNALHILSIGAVLTSVMLMDLRILGAFASIEQAPFIRLLRRVALTAFCGAVLTGVSMFAIRATEYAAMPVFLAKMALIVLAGLNFLAFQRMAGKSGGTRFLAAASIVLWIGVLFAGRFIGFL